MAAVSDPDDSGRVTLHLERGKTGLGFNIKGGSDMPLITGDDGIYVAIIKNDGAAAIDGRLKVGDKILQVNGVSLASVKHEVAVATFVRAGSSVTLVVQKGAETAARKKQTRDTQASEGGWSGTTCLMLGVAGVGILIGLAVYRHKISGIFR